MIMAPHTSNWDFYIGMLGFWALGIKAKVLIKKEAFKPGISFILKKLGGIPVDRSKKTNLVEKAAKMFEEQDDLIILFTPEGTRSYNENWKKGFYHLAVEANVPIIAGYLDYDKKIGSFFPKFIPTGNEDADIAYIKGLYKNVKAKHPEKFGY